MVFRRAITPREALRTRTVRPLASARAIEPVTPLAMTVRSEYMSTRFHLHKLRLLLTCPNAWNFSISDLHATDRLRRRRGSLGALHVDIHSFLRDGGNHWRRGVVGTAPRARRLSRPVHARIESAVIGADAWQHVLAAASFGMGPFFTVMGCAGSSATVGDERGRKLANASPTVVSGAIVTLIAGASRHARNLGGPLFVTSIIMWTSAVLGVGAIVAGCGAARLVHEGVVRHGMGRVSVASIELLPLVVLLLPQVLPGSSPFGRGWRTGDVCAAAAVPSKHSAQDSAPPSVSLPGFPRLESFPNARQSLAA